MRSNSKFFKKRKLIPIDKFFQNVLYDKKFGYYNSKQPFGFKGDYITSPRISNLFSEMIAIWIISTWETFGKPKRFNIVELGPGDGSLTKIILSVSKKFPEFDKAKRVFLFEKSDLLKNIQKKNLRQSEIRWIRNFDLIKEGPVAFFGNEFFDAIPIKQFKRKNKVLYEKYFELQKNFKIKEVFKKASGEDAKIIDSFKTLKNLKFVEFPKYGLDKLDQIIKKILKLKGCLLLIDYGYLGPNNQNTIQSVIKHKKNNILKNLGKADITSHVNFTLLKEFFIKNNLKVLKIVCQKDFLKNMGINERAEIIAKKMNFTDQANLYLRLKRLLSPKLMGSLFKVILAYKNESNNYFGFN